jgi:hypothetical protein
MTLFSHLRLGRVAVAAFLLALVLAAPARAADAKDAKEVRAALAKEIDFPGLDDPKTTLTEFLDLMARKHGLKFKIDEKAFAAEELRAAPNVEVVGAKPLPPLKGVQLDRVLRKVLDRVPVPSGAAFVVRDNVIEVTTEAALARAKVRPEPPPAPTAAMRDREKAARAALAKAVDFRGYDDPKTTLQEALDQLGKVHNLTFDVIDGAFKFEQIDDVTRLLIADPKPVPAMKNQPLSKVLEAVLTRLPKEAHVTYVVRPGGVIEITTARFVEYERKNGRPPRPGALLPMAGM